MREFIVFQTVLYNNIIIYLRNSEKPPVVWRQCTTYQNTDREAMSSIIILTGSAWLSLFILPIITSVILTHKPSRLLNIADTHEIYRYMDYHYRIHTHEYNVAYDTYPLEKLPAQVYAFKVTIYELISL